jgi:arabinose-5-phosphate isomerase
MRGAEQMAVVTARDGAGGRSSQWRGARAAAAVVTETDGTLAGIFTHGDFGRALQTHADLLERVVAEFMTRRPSPCAATSLPLKCFTFCKKSRIDDLVVLDEAGPPIGVVDSQDLARFRLVLSTVPAAREQPLAEFRSW